MLYDMDCVLLRSSVRAEKTDWYRKARFYPANKEAETARGPFCV
jgi:hypothetical protein